HIHLNAPTPPDPYTLSLHDALPILSSPEPDDFHRDVAGLGSGRSTVPPDHRPRGDRRQAPAHAERAGSLDLARRVTRAADATRIRLVRRGQARRLRGHLAARAGRSAVRYHRAWGRFPAARREDTTLRVQALDRAPHPRAVLRGRGKQPLDRGPGAFGAGV